MTFSLPNPSLHPLNFHHNQVPDKSLAKQFSLDRDDPVVGNFSLFAADASEKLNAATDNINQSSGPYE